MTIALGFKCDDGIVLCTDRRISDLSGFHYDEQKIYASVGEGWIVVSAYAGYREIMRLVQDKLRAQLQARSEAPMFDDVQNGLEEILSSLRKTHRREVDRQQMLCAVSTGPDSKLFKAEGDLVTEIMNWEPLGLGDSPLLRYLADLTGIRSARSSAQAFLVALYMVSKTNQYVDGCDGGPDAAIISNGTAEFHWGAQLEYDIFRDAEHTLGSRLMMLTNCVRVDDASFFRAAQDFCDRIPALRRAMRTLLGRSARYD